MTNYSLKEKGFFEEAFVHEKIEKDFEDRIKRIFEKDIEALRGGGINLEELLQKIDKRISDVTMLIDYMERKQQESYTN